MGSKLKRDKNVAKMKKKIYIPIFIIVILILLASGSELIVFDTTDGNNVIPISVDENGQEYYEPSKIAINAIQYCGENSFCTTEVKANYAYAKTAVDWLIENALQNENGDFYWLNIPKEFNASNQGVKEIFSYTQALVIEAFLAYYNISGDNQYLDWAYNAAQLLEKDIKDGGLQITNGNDIWFESDNCEKNNYELIGHIRVLIALKKLYAEKKEDKWNKLYINAVTSLENKIEYYDTGYCYRDNLLIKQDDIKFRFHDNYGSNNPNKIIKEVRLYDPLSKELIDKVSFTNKHTEEFKLCLSREVATDLFRKEWLELEVVYIDNVNGHLNLEKESLLNNNNYMPIKDGDLLLTNSGELKKWLIPLRINDCGYEVSKARMKEYKECFEYLANEDSKFLSERNRSAGYYNLTNEQESYEYAQVIIDDTSLDTPPVPVFSIDDSGVIQQHISSPDTKFDPDGNWIEGSIVGEPVYLLQAIYQQAVNNTNWNDFTININNFSTKNNPFWTKYNFLTPDNVASIKSEPAYEWIENNVCRHNGIATWSYNSRNSYNGLEQEAGWISAYGQSLMIEALIMKKEESYNNLIKEGCVAYGRQIDEGGIADFQYTGDIWFEEVPNKSHILNAHILTLNTLIHANSILNDAEIEKLIEAGVESLKNNIWRYDTGYWSKYDMYPKKINLFQIDWISGDESLYIDEIILYDPISDLSTRIDVGSDNDFGNYPNLAGTEWSGPENMDHRTVRKIINGYLKNKDNKSSEKIMQNSYFYILIPDLEITDYFDICGYKLIIQYKDVAPGEFEIKRQSISEGNFLKFESIPNAIIECSGDGQWKEFEILLRPQDLGWFMGEVYQEYHSSQLAILAEYTNEWIFEQYAQKWSYYATRQE